MISQILSFARQAIRTPGRLVAPAVLFTGKWATAPGAESWAYRTLERLHRERRPETAGKQDSLRRMLARMSFDPVGLPRGSAIVFLHRGDSILHSCHQLLIADGLARLGYAVEFARCDGGVERCGVGQVRAPLAIPPLTCFTCRACLVPLAGASRPIEVLSGRRDPPGPSSDTDELRTALPPDIDTLLYPALLRHFQGNLPEMAADRREYAAHAAAARRFIARCRDVFQRRLPSVVCLFNGQTFPESIIGRVATDMGIPVIYTERGVVPNSMFISRDFPASHYNADRLWDKCRASITDADRSRAREFVTSRRRTNIDPLGMDRDFSRFGGDAAHDALTAEPYAVCFAPVLHDTAAAGKDHGLGEAPEALLEVCRAASSAGVRLVIRSHPDERRPHNPARYTVRQLLQDRGVTFDENMVNLDSDTSWNPYVLAERASHVIVHNGTIAMESAVAGIRPVNTGRSHYCGKGFTLDAQSSEDLRAILKDPVPRLTPAEVATAEAYLHFYLRVATVDVSGLLREGPEFTCAVLPISATADKQARDVEERLAFLLSANAALDGPPA